MYFYMSFFKYTMYFTYDNISFHICVCFSFTTVASFKRSFSIIKFFNFVSFAWMAEFSSSFIFLPGSETVGSYIIQ